MIDGDREAKTETVGYTQGSIGAVRVRSDEGDSTMRQLAALAVLLFASVSAYAFAPKPCEELRAEIAKKLEANNVKSYTLEILAQGKEAEGRVVGSCEAGTKKIVYRRTPTTPRSPAPSPSRR